MFNMTNLNSSIANATNLLENGSDTTTQVIGIATLEQRQFAKYVLFFFVLPFIAIVGMLGNTMSLSVLQVTRRVHAFNVYLMALTSADILLLLLALSRCVVLIVARYPDVRYPSLDIHGEFYLSIVFGTWLQRISSTFISIISIERFVAVAFPFKVKTLAIENHPYKIITCVLIGNLLCQIPTIVLLDVTQMENPETNTTVYGFGLRYPTPAAVVARKIYLVFLAVINMFVPLLIVSTSTVAILICLKMRSTSMNLNRTNAKEAKERETMTLTLVSMAIIFTLCYIPAIIIYIISASGSSFYRTEVYLISIMVDINVVSVCVNSASDFLIYFLRSKEFRMLFVTRFVPCVKMQPSPSGSSPNPAPPSGHKKTSTTEVPRSPETSFMNVSDIIET